MFILDEFNNIISIPNFTDFLDRARAHKTWWICVVQSLKKTKQKYGSIQTLLSNFYIKITLGTDADFDITSLFKNYLKDIKKESTSSGSLGYKSTSLVEAKEEAINPYNIKTLSGDYAYVHLRNKEPMLTVLQPMYKWDYKLEIDQNLIKTSAYSPVLSLDLFNKDNKNNIDSKSIKQDIINLIKQFYIKDTDISKERLSYISMYLNKYKITDENLWNYLENELILTMAKDIDNLTNQVEKQ